MQSEEDYANKSAIFNLPDSWRLVKSLCKKTDRKGWQNAQFSNNNLTKFEFHYLLTVKLTQNFEKRVNFAKC